MTALTIPDLPPGCDTETAARLYAEAGWYVLPIDAQTKHAGSLVGKGWQLQSSRDPNVITAWWQRWPAAGLALHVGRSGAVVFDVDHPEAVPAVLRAAIEACDPPHQSSRLNIPGRGHFLFAAVPGRFGNALGDLGKGWGDVRGLNSIIVVAPTPHSKAAEGAAYTWLRNGALPPIPEALAECLRPPGASRGTVDDAEVLAWLDALPDGEPGPAVAVHLTDWPKKGRHGEMLDRTMKLARVGEQGHHGVATALGELQETYVLAVEPDRPGGAGEAEDEYARALAGAVAAVVAAPTPEADKGCCPSHLQDEWLRSQGFNTEALVAARGAVRTAPADGGAEMLPPPTDPRAVARIIATGYQHDGRTTLLQWRGAWMRWRGAHWTEAEDAELYAALYHRLERAKYVKTSAKGSSVVPWAPNRRTVGDVLHALGSLVWLPSELDAPSWLDGGAHPAVLVSCANGLLDVTTRELHPQTPAYFNLVSVPFDYAPDAPAPKRWIEFLVRLWGHDPDSITALQDWFGYVLSGRTNLQKIFAVVGPMRSGKGTIARILRELIGHRSYAGPTLASLGTNFGLQPLIGVLLAVISDARLGGKTDAAVVVERLLTVSGEDAVTIDRKYRDEWTGRLPTRFMLLSNEVPAFRDASAAIASRFVILTLRESWLGREDTALGEALTTELPGILNWSLDGLARVTAAGRLTEPASSRDEVSTMADLASPESAFARDHCIIGPEHQATPEQLFAAWRGWCRDNGREHPGTKDSFMRNLRAAFPSLGRRRVAVDGQRVRTVQGIGVRPATSMDASIVSSEKISPPSITPIRADNGKNPGRGWTAGRGVSPPAPCPHGCTSDVPYLRCNPSAGMCTTCQVRHDQPAKAATS
jgi:putative DNA primase/helicase